MTHLASSDSTQSIQSQMGCTFVWLGLGLLKFVDGFGVEDDLESLVAVLLVDVVLDPEDALQLHVDAGLFDGLADGSLHEVFGRVDQASREPPALVAEFLDRQVLALLVPADHERDAEHREELPVLVHYAINYLCNNPRKVFIHTPSSSTSTRSCSTTRCSSRSPSSKTSPKCRQPSSSKQVHPSNPFIFQGPDKNHQTLFYFIDGSLQVEETLFYRYFIHKLDPL